MGGITRFMDYTEHEYSQLLGYKGRSSRAASAAVAPTSPDKAVANLLSEDPPSEFTVDLDGILNPLVRDQGACGSCWTEAAAAVLEGMLQYNSSLLSKLSV